MIGLVVIAVVNASILALFAPQPRLAVPTTPQTVLPSLVVLGLTIIGLRRAFRLELSIVKAAVLSLAAQLSYVGILLYNQLDFVDNDLTLIKGYVADFCAGGYPAMEYPEGVLYWYSLPFKLGGSEQIFQYFFIGTNVLASLIIIWGLVTLSRQFGKGRAGLLAGVWWALVPYNLVFNPSKFDEFVAATLVLGTVAYGLRRYLTAGFFFGFGFALKWLPILAAPILVLRLLVTKKYTQLAMFVVGVLAPIVVMMARYYFLHPLTFRFTYYFHNIRMPNAESIYYLLIHFIQPDMALSAYQAPWTDITGSIFGRTLTSAIQVGLIGLLTVGALRWRSRRNSLVFAFAAVFVFIMFNRVFSPQYFLYLASSGLAMGVLALDETDLYRQLIAALVTAFAGYQIWPTFSSWWLAYSFLFFAGLLVMLVLPLIKVILYERD